MTAPAGFPSARATQPAAPEAARWAAPAPSPAYRLDRRLARGLAATAAVCAIAFTAGAFLAPERAWAGLLVGFHLVLSVALAGGVFLALLACSGARWADALRRVPEAMSEGLPVAAVGALVLLFGVPSLFEWSHAEALAEDALLREKSAYLNAPFLAARTVAAFALWIWLAARVRAAPRGASRIRWSAAFMAVFAVTYSLASVDWLQSLEPHWASTAFALTTLAGLGLSGLAAATVLAVHLRRSGAWQGVLGPDQVHDLARLLFSFAVFWGYVHYAQYMLIWYTNLPEETAWYVPRLEGMWGTTGVLSFALNCAVPFLVLLFRRARRSETTVLRVACLVLVGRVADLFFHAGPPLFREASPWPSPWEVLPVLGMVALLAVVVLQSLERTGAISGESGHAPR